MSRDKHSALIGLAIHAQCEVPGRNAQPFIRRVELRCLEGAFLIARIEVFDLSFVCRFVFFFLDFLLPL